MAIFNKGLGKGFSDRQREILTAFTETLLPPDVGTPLQPTEDNFLRPAERFLAAMGAESLRGFVMLILLFEYAALVFYPRFKTFTRLNPEQRERYMYGWENSRISLKRQVFIILKFFVSFVFLSNREIQASLGYDPECLVEPGG